MKPPVRIKWLLTILLIIIGWHLLFEGFIKVLDTGWSSASYLKNSTGPLAPVFKSLANSEILLKIVDLINIYGQIILGILLMTGLFIRFAALGAAILLMIYYISNPPLSATAVGYAMEGHYLLVNKNLIEAFTLVVLASMPGSWFYGLQNIIKFKEWHKPREINTPIQQQVSKGGYPINRRELLKNLIWVPFLSSLVFLSLRTKKKGIDAISGATETMDFDYSPAEIADQSKIYTPNEPMGIAKGIFPGRVTWIWDPSATNPDCKNRTVEKGALSEEKDDAWFMDRNTNQEVVDKMLIDGIKSISGEKKITKAWDLIFRYHNKTRGKGEISYQKGEKIFIKTNRTSAAWGWNDDYSRLDKIDSLCCETSPQICLSILRQLVNEAGIPQNAIFIGDPMTGLFKDEYEKYHSEFPEVNYIARTGNMKGRTPVKEGSKYMIFYSDNGKIMESAGQDKFYDVLENAEYLISLSAMKGHDAAGISLCTKNHFGTQSRPKALHLHPGLNVERRDGKRVTRGYGNYRVLADLMGSKYTGGRNLFYILDGLWSGCGWNGLPVKYLMPPFNNHWSSSLLLSLDPVAIESVAFDFLRTEFSLPEHHFTYVAAEGSDDYLHQVADSKNWPEGIIYSPDGDGKPMSKSLGVHEHWNNSTDKQYTRDLETGNGIELIKILRG